MDSSPPNPALEPAQPRRSTVLADLFRRIGGEPPAPASPISEAAPLWLGFAELVPEGPQAEIFVPAIDSFAALESVPPAELAAEIVEWIELGSAEAEPTAADERPTAAAEEPADGVAFAEGETEAAVALLIVEAEPEAPVEFTVIAAELEVPVKFASFDTDTKALADVEPLAEPPPPPVREPPPFPAAAAAPQTMIGRLAWRIGQVPLALRPAGAPAGEPATQRPADPAHLSPMTAVAPAPPPPEAPQKRVAPGSAAAMDRPGHAGHPSMPRNRRLYRRATLPAEIEITGVPCMLIDLSIGGFAATGVPAIEPDSIVPVAIRLTIDGIEVGTELKARIVYANQARSSGRFTELTSSQTAFLRYIVTWRGESVGAVGTTTLLDAIVGGAHRSFADGSSELPDAAPRERWWAGWIGKKVAPPQ